MATITDGTHTWEGLDFSDDEWKRINDLARKIKTRLDSKFKARVEAGLSGYCEWVEAGSLAMCNDLLGFRAKIWICDSNGCSVDLTMEKQAFISSIEVSASDFEKAVMDAVKNLTK